MDEIREQLLKVIQELDLKNESSSDLIKRLKNEGKCIEEIECAILELNQIQGVYDSVVTALRILEM